MEIIISIAICIVPTLLLARMVYVHIERERLLSKLPVKSDMEANRDWSWRYTEIQTPSINSMAVRFWRPVRSFYRDALFDPNGRPTWNEPI